MAHLLPKGIDETGGQLATMQQQVHATLRQDIMLGRIAPGEPLTIRGLSKRLGVSAMPVREALRRLAAEQAIELLGNRRIRIPQMTATRFDDLLAARIALESTAAMRALPDVNDHLIAELEAIDAGIGAAMGHNDFDVWIAANFAFHRALYSARSGNIFMPLIESLWLQIGPFLRQALKSIGPTYTVDRHQEMLAAVKRRDPVALGIAIEADLRDGARHIGCRLMRSEQADDYAPGPRAKRKKLISR